LKNRDHAVSLGPAVNKLREFIKAKYLDKKWYSEDGSSQLASAPEPSAAGGIRHQRASISLGSNAAAAKPPAPAAVSCLELSIFEFFS
jgi:hypothetical protein